MMNNQLLVSVIVAFYNEEELLPRCLNSVKGQTHHNIELVLINDGSTDGSLEVAKSYRSSFKRLKIVTIENSGHSEARNVGLKNMAGDYVTFLDADDELMPSMIQRCINQLTERRADMAVCKFSILNAFGQVELVSGWKNEVRKIFKTAELIDPFLSNGVSENVWGKLYKSKLAKRISFCKGLWFDDRPYVFEYILMAETVCFVDESLLNIHKRSTSITRRLIEKKRLIDCYKVFQLSLESIEKYGKGSKVKYLASKHYIGVLVNNYIFQIMDKEQVEDLKEVRATFNLTLNQFNERLKHESIRLKLKDRLNMLLLNCHRFLGWNISNRLFVLAKKKRMAKIRQLR